jgi:hypothetical protein
MAELARLDAPLVLVDVTQSAMAFLGYLTPRRGTSERQPISAISRWLSVLAISWTLGVSLVLAVAVFGIRVPLAFVPMLVPIALSLVPLRAGDAQEAVRLCGLSALLVGAFSFVSGFSIGVAFAPSAFLITAAGFFALRGSFARGASRETPAASAPG